MMRWLLALGLGFWLAGCVERRPRESAEISYEADVAPLLERACFECHGDERTAAGYSVQNHWSTIGCAEAGEPVVLPRDERAPLIAVLERKDHRRLLSAHERAKLLAWVEAGAPAQRAVLHAEGILDPRSSGWHGALAAKANFRALRDPEDELACGKCHQDAPVRPKGATQTAGATACSHCHQERESVLSCSTCHGDEGRSYPPRDGCYFGGAERDPHATHVGMPAVRTEGFSCKTCHPMPGEEVLSKQHADGKVDVRFSSPLVNAGDKFESGACAVACHTLGGRREEPKWEASAPLDCQSCHESPPRDHPPGTCDTCHGNMKKDPDSLIVDARHMNGKVDIGRGAFTCGACHGEGEDGAPSDISHRQHVTPSLTTDIACETCHQVPELADLHQPSTHMNGAVEVMLSGRAARPDTAPVYDVATRTCSQVACHGDERVLPLWGTASGAAEACAACHDTPPPPPHSRQPGCGGALCHGAEVAATTSGYLITESGRALHIDGTVQP